MLSNTRGDRFGKNSIDRFLRKWFCEELYMIHRWCQGVYNVHIYGRWYIMDELPRAALSSHCAHRQWLPFPGEDESHYLTSQPWGFGMTLVLMTIRWRMHCTLIYIHTYTISNIHTRHLKGFHRFIFNDKTYLKSRVLFSSWNHSREIYATFDASILE